MQYYAVLTALNKYKSLSQHKLIKAFPIVGESQLEVRLSKSQLSEIEIIVGLAFLKVLSNKYFIDQCKLILAHLIHLEQCSSVDYN